MTSKATKPRRVNFESVLQVAPSACYAQQQRNQVLALDTAYQQPVRMASQGYGRNYSTYLLKPNTGRWLAVLSYLAQRLSKVKVEG